MLKREKPFKPTSKMLRKAAASRSREFNKWHRVDSSDQPRWTVDKPHGDSLYLQCWKIKENERIAKRQRDLILYAAAMGQKTGTLSVELSRFTAEVIRTAGSIHVDFYIPDISEFPHAKRNAIRITPRFLDWTPSEPLEEAVYQRPVQ